MWPFLTGKSDDSCSSSLPLGDATNAGEPTSAASLRELEETLRISGVECRKLTAADSPIDIWIRDWGPIDGCFFRYAPSYANGFYTAPAIATARNGIAEIIGHEIKNVPLVLDGGNLVHNGTVAIVTEKGLLDNPVFSRGEIERIIVATGFQRVVFIPTEPHDEVGHADGILRFLDSKTLLVNEYSSPEFRNYRRRLLKALSTQLADVEIVPFPWFAAKKTTVSGQQKVVT